MLLAQRFNPADLSLLGDAVPVAQGVGRWSFSGNSSGVLSHIQGVAAIARLTWFDRSGKAVGEAGPEGDYGQVAISRTGRWLAYTADSTGVPEVYL